jgi:ribonuclease Z
LIGLLSTLNLYGRKDPLYIFSPEGLEPLIMAQLKVSDSELNYPVHFEVISEKGSKLLVQAKRYSIEAFPLDHRIETYGFLIKEKKRERSIIKEKIIGEDIPVQFFNEIKAGKDFIRQDGSILRNDSITEPGIPVRSFAYCSDTKYNESLIEHIEGCDLLLHEATFTNEFADLAESRFHSTAEQAGKIASKAKVKKMLISHFSARYETTDLLLEEAKKSFENTIVAPENIKISL